MLEIIRNLQKKIWAKLPVSPIILLAFAVYAEPCTECNQVQDDLAKQISTRENYLVLKGKNEAYLKRPDVSPGAAIKVQSNLVLLGIKIETLDNNIKALMITKEKLNNCEKCPWPNEKKS